MPGPLVAAGLSFLGGVANNIWNASEAKKNRQFQERMSSTAHQREVADLKAANINSAWRSMSGASSPGGDRAEMEDAVGKGVSSGLQAKQVMAQIGLTHAQTDRERASAQLIGREFLDKQATGRPGDPSSEAAQTALRIMQLDESQRRQLLPHVIAKAKEEVGQVANSARAAKLRADLDELAKEGAKNLADFERSVGVASPWVKAAIQIIRSVRSIR